MKQYLTIVLADDAPRYCHWTARRHPPRTIVPEALRQALVFAMKRRMAVSLVWPERPLPEELTREARRCEHTDIRPIATAQAGDMAVAESVAELLGAGMEEGRVYALATTFDDFIAGHEALAAALRTTCRLSIALSGLDKLDDAALCLYGQALDAMAATLADRYTADCQPQVSLLTDRIQLQKMNNCGAGDTSLAVCPDGRFYVCPAFYFEPDGFALDASGGEPQVANAQLYRLDHAPICRLCDAWQCRRCVWLNRRTTLEVNTPSRQQCLAAHYERRAARHLLLALRERGLMPDSIEIASDDCMDPFEKIKERIME